MATTYTTLLELAKHASTDPFDVTLLNDNADTLDAAMGKAYRGKAVQNLLDNSDFLSPVNQRGQTSYTASGYNIDRWTATGGTTAIGSSGLTLTGETVTVQWRQYLSDDAWNAIKGKAFTFACCVSDGTVIISTGTLPAGAQTSAYSSTLKQIGTTGIYANLYMGAGERPRVRFYTSGANTATIRWAALYVGTYTASTLPDYVPKGYAAELLECQRYYCNIGEESWLHGARVLGDGMTVLFQTVHNMRIKPTAIFDAIKIFGGQGWKTATSCVVTRVPQGIKLTLGLDSADSADFGTGNVYLVKGVKALSADL